MLDRDILWNFVNSMKANDDDDDDSESLTIRLPVIGLIYKTY